MQKKKITSYSIEELSNFLYSARYLDSMQEMMKNYPEFIKKKNLLKIHTILLKYVDKSLQLEDFKSLKEIYNKPEFSPQGSNDSIKILFTVPLTWIRLEIFDKPKDFETLTDLEIRKEIIEIYKFSYEKISAELKQAVDSLKLIMILDCHIPISASNEDFLSKPRLMFLLSKYFEIYAEYIQYRTTAYMWFIPDPLVKFTTSLKIRIRKLIELLEINKETSIILEFIELPPEDVDAIPDQINSMINYSIETLEIQHTKFGHEIFPFTEQEKLFIDSFNSHFQENRTHAEKHFHNFLNNTEKNSSNSSSKELQKELTCSEYIREVELKLRDLIKKQYLIKYGNNWIFGIKEAIGKNAYLIAVNTMEQRKITDLNELLHFTTLPDLQQAIKNKWDLFKDIIPIKRKEFNILLIPILKGRTEEAHNRPKHLWPEIEQQRVRVACKDLLSKIK